jgi:hypothetical protein
MSSEPHPLQPMLNEALTLLEDRDVVKAQSTLATVRLIVRCLETLVHGKALTRIPPKNEHLEDFEPPPQPMPSRRL